MPTSLILVCLWAITANVLAMRPSDNNHWRLAYILIIVGIPILGYVTWQTGPWIGLACLIGAASMLRWPMVYLWRWLRRPQHGVTEE